VYKVKYSMRLKLKFTLYIVTGSLLFIILYRSLHESIRKKLHLLSQFGSSKFDVKSYIDETRLLSDRDALKRHKFNQWISDLLPWDRSIPNTCHRKCSFESYDASLPSTSIIITFHNEARSTLLRTIKSITTRSRWELVKEIILIDDYSDNVSDGEFLTSISTKIILKRNLRREGLIRSRLLGASIASGEVLTFLDSHCEVNERWLTPLLAAIKKDPQQVVSPVIDIIRLDTFKYVASSSQLKGASIIIYQLILIIHATNRQNRRF